MTAPFLVLLSPGRSTSLPWWKVASARTRATRWGALTARQRVWAVSNELERHGQAGRTGAGAFGDLGPMPHGREGRLHRYLELLLNFAMRSTRQPAK